MEAELIELCIESCYTYDVYIYIWAKRDILLALGLNMKYSTLKRVTQEYYTQFSWQWYDKLALFFIFSPFLDFLAVLGSLAGPGPIFLYWGVENGYKEEHIKKSWKIFKKNVDMRKWMSGIL